MNLENASIWLFSALLRLYPKCYRSQFKEEMVAVYAQNVQNLGKASNLEVLSLLWNELRDAPENILHEYLIGLQGGMMNHNLENKTPRWALGMVLLFLIFPGLMDINPAPQVPWVGQILLPVLFFTLVGAPLVTSLISKLPRWSLVIIGTYLGVVGVFGVSSNLRQANEPSMLRWMNKVVLGNGMLGRLEWQWIQQGLSWMGIVLVVLVFLGILWLVPPFRKVFRRLQADWTQVSFILYGAVLVIYVIDFDEYRYDVLFQVASLVSLALGAWGYLSAATPSRQTLILLSGMTVCMAIMGVGKYFLVPLQEWPFWFSRHPIETERLFESLRTIGSWFWMALFIGLPGLIQYNLHKRRTQHQAQITGA